jgi:hypothetical protein
MALELTAQSPSVDRFRWAGNCIGRRKRRPRSSTAPGNLPPSRRTSAWHRQAVRATRCHEGSSSGADSLITASALANDAAVPIPNVNVNVRLFASARQDCPRCHLGGTQRIHALPLPGSIRTMGWPGIQGEPVFSLQPSDRRNPTLRLQSRGIPQSRGGAAGMGTIPNAE